MGMIIFTQPPRNIISTINKIGFTKPFVTVTVSLKNISDFIVSRIVICLFIVLKWKNGTEWRHERKYVALFLGEWYNF